MKSAAELRQGSTYRKDNVPYLILKAERHQSTSGKRQRAAEVKFKIKDLISGKIQEITVLATDLMDDIILDRNQMQFLYETDGEYNFMDQETFEQIALTEEDLGDAKNFLEEEMIIQVLMYEGKPATVSTGYTLQVPLFVAIGDKIEIDTRTGEYIGRA